MGRELASLTKDGTTYNYKYNYDGLRTYKSDGTNTYNYIWQDGKLISQTGADNTIKLIYENEKPTAINYNGTEYYYVTNLQGDVMAILDSNGNCVVEYAYDAWGKVLSITGSMANSIGSHNPLRYRGYYYDRESGFYYLKSRYYDPNTGKFLNADSVNMLVSGEKAYTYCGNNPINFSDPTGSAYTDRPMYEYFNVNAWSDTLLHLGFSLDQSTVHDFFLIYGNWKEKSSYVFNVNDLYDPIMYSIINQELSLIERYLIYNIYTPYRNEVKAAFKDFASNVANEKNLANQIGENFGEETQKIFEITNSIYGQDILSSFLFRNSSAPSSSCGAVSVYNALILLGKKVSISDIFFIIDMNNPFASGGINATEALELLSDKYDYKYKITTDASEFYKWSEVHGRILVAAHWNDAKEKGASHATCAYVAPEGMINIYNYYNSSTDVFCVRKWADGIEEARFIEGAYVYE